MIPNSSQFGAKRWAIVAERIGMTIWHRLLHKYHSIERFADRKKNVLGLVAAVAGVVAAVIAGLALIYVVRAETRRSWNDVHNAMINLREQQSFVTSLETFWMLVRMLNRKAKNTKHTSMTFFAVSR
jgi:hypothetical protein